MEKEITLSNSRLSLQDTIANILKLLCRPAEWLRHYFSQVLEREVTMRQTLAIVNSQLSGTLTVFCSFDSILLHFAVAAWFIYALVCCAKQ